jgi:hypothetical protein
MPLDIVTPAISSSEARQNRWQPRLSRAAPPRASAGPSPPEISASETSGIQTQPTGSCTAFLAQTLAQSDVNALRLCGPVAPAKATSITQRYEIAESRDPILRGDPILFRLQA